MCPKSNKKSKKKKYPTIPVGALVNAAMLTTAFGVLGHLQKERSVPEKRMVIARRRLSKGKVKRRFVSYLF